MSKIYLLVFYPLGRVPLIARARAGARTLRRPLLRRPRRLLRRAFCDSHKFHRRIRQARRRKALRAVVSSLHLHRKATSYSSMVVCLL